MTNSQTPGAANRPPSLPARPPLPPPWVLIPLLYGPPRPPVPGLPPVPPRPHGIVHTLNAPHAPPPAYPPPFQPSPGNFFTPKAQFNQYSAQPAFPAAPGPGSGQVHHAPFFNPNLPFYDFPPPPVPLTNAQPFQGAPVIGQAANQSQTSASQQQASQRTAPKCRIVNGKWQANPLHTVRSDTESPSRVEKSQKSQKSQTPPAMADALLRIQDLNLGQDGEDEKSQKYQTLHAMADALLHIQNPNLGQEGDNENLQESQTPHAMADAFLQIHEPNLGQAGKDKTESQGKKKGRKARKEDYTIVLKPPQPTQDYLHHSAKESTLAEIPQNMLVVLDLNGTLLYRPSRHRPTHFIARPNLQPFLDYLFQNFYVMVWSSAMPANVEGMISKAFGKDQRSELIATWARDTFGLSQQHYNMKVQVYKDLRRVWNDRSIQMNCLSLPGQGMFKQLNTILIDDSILKASAQPFNLLKIPEFTATDAELKSDILREVAGYLDVVKKQSNVSNFMRNNPFYADGTWTYDWPDEPNGVPASLKQEYTDEVASDEEDAGGVTVEEEDVGGVKIEA